MSKLTNKESLEKLAKALDSRSKALVKSSVAEEAARAKAEEAALQAAINGKANASHSHDDRYYTETEINNIFADLEVTLNEAFDELEDGYEAADIALQTAINGKSPLGHTHDDRYFTETEINNKLAGYSATGHNHDDKYYTETEIDAKITTINSAISTAKSDAQKYADTKIAALVDSAPDALNTLNELATAINDHQDVYDTYITEMDAKLAQKEDKGHTHNYAGSSSAGGAATSANKVNSNLVVKLNGGATEGTNLFTFNGSTAKTINITPSGIGAAASSHGTHVTYGTATPKANGTAAVGTSDDVSRADHVHPLQTTVSGNAGSANKWTNPISLTIGNKGKNVDGSANVSWTLTEIGAMPHTVTTTSLDLNESKTTGVYNLKASSHTNAPTTGNATLFVNFDVGTPYQLFMHDATFKLYYRSYNTTAATWNDWSSTLGNDISGKAATATKLATARTINGTNFDGSGNITTTSWGAARLIYIADNSTTNTGPAISVNGSGDVTLKLPTTIKAALTGNASTATALQNGRKINGTSFNGTGDITTANWGASRNLQIGLSSKPVNGSAGVSWSLAEIGASPLQKSIVGKTVSNGTLTLSTDRYQYATLANGNTIALPSVSNFTEINLFVKDCNISTINLPDNCKWRVDPNLDSGDSFMFTFFYTGQEWLAEVKIYS